MKTIVWSVIFSVVLSGVASAQQSDTPLAAVTLPSTTVSCEGHLVIVHMTQESWNKMDANQQENWCGQATFKTPKDKAKTGRAIMWSGVGVALVGVAMLGPWGQQYEVLGDTYCVTDYSVDYGSCNASGRQAMIGLAFVGAGIGIALGGYRLAVSPQVKQGAVGVTGRVTWGDTNHGKRK